MLLGDGKEIDEAFGQRFQAGLNIRICLSQLVDDALFIRTVVQDGAAAA